MGAKGGDRVAIQQLGGGRSGTSLYVVQGLLYLQTC